MRYDACARPPGPARTSRLHSRLPALLATLLAGACLLACPAGDPRAGTGLGDPFPAGEPEDVGVSAEQLAAAVQEIQGWVESDEIVGAVLMVVRDGRTILRESAGWADREKDVPMQADMIFQLRSMTKVLVATAVLQLIEQGRLNLDDRVVSFITSFDRPGYRDITVFQLLTHTSGMSGGLASSGESLQAEVDRLASTRSLAYAPGTGRRYTDAGTSTLGALVEVITGEPINSYLAREIFQPLGMQDSWCGPLPDDDPRLPRIAARYSGGPGAWSKYSELGEQEGWQWCRASGGVYATIADFARFLATWKNGGELHGVRIMGEPTVAHALQPHSQYVYTPEERYGEFWFEGLKWRVFTDSFGPYDTPESPGSFYHAGSDGTIAWADPAQDLMVLFFTQSRQNEKRFPPHMSRLIYPALIRR